VGADGVPSLVAFAAASSSLVAGNLAVSVSVWRDGRPVLGAATGTAVGGGPVTTDSPMALASVSKLITALSVARLAQAGLVDVASPVPWERIGIPRHPDWDGVTVRELLSHGSGMPVARQTWLDDPGTCAEPLAAVLAEPPRAHRGRWTYSNGNYCALGLLVEALTGADLEQAAALLVLGPAGVTGPHTSVHGLLPGDGPFVAPLARVQDVRRLDRLGGAGAWLASSDDVAAVLADVTPADLETLVWPGVFVDQYGWGHSGTVDGAKVCAWVLEGGRTVMVAIVSGNRPSSGGRVCDRLVPALAGDLGLGAGPSLRSPT